MRYATTAAPTNALPVRCVTYVTGYFDTWETFKRITAADIAHSCCFRCDMAADLAAPTADALKPADADATDEVK